MFFNGMPAVTPESFAHKKLSQDQVRQLLQLALWELDVQRQWDHDSIADLLTRLSNFMGHKMRDFMAPFFVAISGSPSSPPVMEAMSILGADITRARLRHAMQLLGAPSKKESKEWEKQLAAFRRGDAQMTVDSGEGAA